EPVALLPSLTLRPPGTALFPYTTLFRSAGRPRRRRRATVRLGRRRDERQHPHRAVRRGVHRGARQPPEHRTRRAVAGGGQALREDRKSTRLNSSHVKISYAVFCLKKKMK